MSETLINRLYKNGVKKADTQHSPDVLSCLSNLSNDEVFTPPELVNEILDLLPQELFTNPNTTFLDPGCKTGVFLREIAKRLLVGLEPIIPDLQERIDHIFHKQLFGIGITELTSLLARRSLYCSKYPNGPYSITKFDTSEGNIRFKKIKHTWKNGRCIYCGANQDEYDRDLDKETHAYEFIHDFNSKGAFNMAFFDVIISNVPYQMSDGGAGASATPIYHKFVEQAIKLNPRYLTMIIPARWYAGGKGLDDFRKNMLNDKHISNLVDYVNAKDCFPGTSIGGGVCYFLRERDYEGPCKYTNIHGDHVSTTLRQLDEYPVFVRYNEALSIINKVKEVYQPDRFADHVGSRNPFGISSSMRGDSRGGDYLLHSSAGTSYIPQSVVKQGYELIDKYKIMISKVTAEHAGEPDKNGQVGVLSTAKIIKPKEVCTDSYLIAYANKDKTITENCLSYMNTKFFRFLLLQAVSSINLSKDKFQFIPEEDYSHAWTDEMLYDKYKLSKEEREFIEMMIKEKTTGDDE